MTQDPPLLVNTLIYHIPMEKVPWTISPPKNHINAPTTNSTTPTCFFLIRIPFIIRIAGWNLVQYFLLDLKKYSSWNIFGYINRKFKSWNAILKVVFGGGWGGTFEKNHPEIKNIQYCGNLDYSYKKVYHLNAIQQPIN